MIETFGRWPACLIASTVATTDSPTRSGRSTGGGSSSRIRTGRRCSADFDYSARLTEIMLLGNVASRVGGKLAYDFRTGKFTNSEKANGMLKREPRKGFEFGYV